MKSFTRTPQGLTNVLLVGIAFVSLGCGRDSNTEKGTFDQAMHSEFEQLRQEGKTVLECVTADNLNYQAVRSGDLTWTADVKNVCNRSLIVKVVFTAYQDSGAKLGLDNIKIEILAMDSTTVRGRMIGPRGISKIDAARRVHQATVRVVPHFQDITVE